MNKKFKKFKNNPKLFFKDMIDKRINKIVLFFKAFLPKRYNGHYSYTVVSAVYNVEKYLDDYFKSIVNQRLDFERNIHLVMVDDGSPDESAMIIKKWQKRFPNNITYVHKENGGQASARNTGIPYVKTRWVVFTDPDDFIDPYYFLEIDKFLQIHQYEDVKAIASNFVFFYENTNTYKDTHPLKYKFSDGNKILQIKNQNRHIQLAVNSTFFLTEEIEKHHIRFDEELKPSFEDARFVADYLLPHQDAQIGFVASSKYYYRKRDDGSSTLDTAWEKPNAFDLALRKGPLTVFDSYQKQLGSISKSIQNMVLYHVFWQIRKIVNNPESLSFLDDVQKSRYVELLDEIFSYIDEKTILEFNLAGCWFYHKVGMLGAFKNQSPKFQICYIDKFDTYKRQIRLKYFTHQESLESIQLDGQEVIPDFIKIVKHDFLDRVFTYEYILWIHIPVSSQILKVYNDNKSTQIIFNHEPYDEISISQLNTFLLPVSISIDPIYGKCWILMDRDNQADDNAEHLYRYIAKKHPEKKIYFALRKMSHDWERLSKEGFNLLDFGSLKFEKALAVCDKIISSHADAYITHYFSGDTMKNKHFVFLQHGVIHNDLSHWLNPKTINLFITATKPEYESIAGDNNRYRFTQKEVMLTGLPRHDALLKNNRYDGKMILIMPTWRANIVGKAIDANTREINPNFMETEYAKHWNSVLHSNALMALAEAYGYKVVYFPHSNIQPYLPMLSIPENIEVLSHQDKTIQELFQEASLMITDYSSVAFEMGVLEKPVIYYQFDEDEFIGGSHTSKKGYFDYRKDGFGPVVTEECVLLEELKVLLENDAVPQEPYKTRIAETFAFRDQHNCERVYNAIVELDEPYNEDKLDIDLALTYAIKAYEAQEWKIAKQRFDYIQLITKRQTKDVNDKSITVSLENYCLDMLKSNELLLIENVQNTVLDALGWYIKEIVDKPEKVEFLTSEQKNHYLELLDEIFSYIDKAFILKYDPSKLWFFYKVGILSCFKNEKSDYQIAYVHEMNTTKQQICLRYFTHKEEIASIEIDGADVVPAYTKTIQHDVIDRVFVYEQRIWIHIPISVKSLKVFVDGMQAPLFFKGKQHKELGAAELYESVIHKDLLFSRYLQQIKKVSKKMIKKFSKKVKNIVKKESII